MIGASITITDKLAERIGRIAANHPDSAVTIRYDDNRAETLWEVSFDGPTEDRYIVDDQTGDVVWQLGVHIGKIPIGIAYPTNVGTAPEGWSWVERDDEQDVYAGDEDAAEALITAGIGTEWSYFHRQSHARITPLEAKGDLSLEVCSGGYSVAINVPEPHVTSDNQRAEDLPLRFDEERAEEGSDCPRCDGWIPAYRTSCVDCDWPADNVAT